MALRDGDGMSIHQPHEQNWCQLVALLAVDITQLHQMHLSRSAAWRRPRIQIRSRYAYSIRNMLNFAKEQPQSVIGYGSTSSS